jgi:hypothetical protein
VLGVKGLVGQGMDGRKAVLTPYTTNYPVGSWTFTTPASGAYKFILWGGGAVGQNVSFAGASGAYSEYTRNLGYGETVALVVGAAGAASTATFRDTKVVTAGGAAAMVAGVASGGDVNLDGSAGVVHSGVAGANGSGTGGGAGGTTNGTIAGGAGAPAVLPHRGGAGQSASASTTQTPGAGGASQASTFGGDGLILVERVS